MYRSKALYGPLNIINITILISCSKNVPTGEKFL